MKTIIVLFGITGDLSKRKLLPALGRICGALPESTEVIGISRRHVAVDEVVPADSQLCAQTQIVTMNLDNIDDYTRLRDQHLSGDDTQILIYLAVPPLSIPTIIENLGKAELNHDRVKLLLEKPFGVDEQSAEALFSQVAQVFHEEQLYRVDHYLSKRVSREIIPFRRQSTGLAQIWNRENIDRIEIVATETLDIEARAAFYEQTGALRDVLQGHLLQLLALTIASTNEELAVAEARAHVFDMLILAEPAYATRGQYEGYRDEAGSPDSQVETFAEVTLYSGDQHWTGVPMILSTGKALDKKETVIRVYFRDTNHIANGCLSFDIQPEERIVACFDGQGQLADTIQREIAEFPVEGRWDSYENVFLDALAADKTYFVTKDEVLASWRVVDEVLRAWQLGIEPLLSYTKGSSLQSLRDKRRL